MFVQGVADLGKHDEENEETGDWGRGQGEMFVPRAQCPRCPDKRERESRERVRERRKGEAGMSVGGGARRQHK